MLGVLPCILVRGSTLACLRSVQTIPTLAYLLSFLRLLPWARTSSSRTLYARSPALYPRVRISPCVTSLRADDAHACLPPFSFLLASLGEDKLLLFCLRAGSPNCSVDSCPIVSLFACWASSPNCSDAKPVSLVKRPLLWARINRQTHTLHCNFLYIPSTSTPHSCANSIAW